MTWKSYLTNALRKWTNTGVNRFLVKKIIQIIFVPFSNWVSCMLFPELKRIDHMPTICSFMMYMFQIMKQTIGRELEKYTNKPEFLSKISQEPYFIFCGVFGTFLIMLKCITDAYQCKKKFWPTTEEGGVVLYIKI